MRGETHYDRRQFLGVVAMTIAAGQLGGTGRAMAQSAGAARPADEGEMASLSGDPRRCSRQELSRQT